MIRGQGLGAYRGMLCAVANSLQHTTLAIAATGLRRKSAVFGLYLMDSALPLVSVGPVVLAYGPPRRDDLSRYEIDDFDFSANCPHV